MSDRSGHGPVLAIRVLWTEPVDFQASTATRLFIHPCFLVFQIAVFVAISLSNNDPDLSGTPFAYRGLVYLGGLVATSAIVFGFIRHHARRIRQGRHIVQLSPVLLLANCIVIPATDWFERTQFRHTDFDPLTLLALVLFYGAMSQIGTALLMAFFGQQIARDIATDGTLPDPGPTDAAAGTDSTGRSDGVGIGGVRVDALRLVMLEAQGNYVDIVTDTARHRVAGPLAARLAEVPSGIGRLVHRSVWVRDGAVLGFRREGRDLFLELDGGHSVVTAQSRRAELLPWLQSLPVPEAPQPSNRSA